MTLEQALLKIIELQQEVTELRKQLSNQITTTPYQQSPFICKSPDLCSDGGLHEQVYDEFRNEIQSLQRRLLGLSEIVDGKTKPFARGDDRTERFKRK